MITRSLSLLIFSVLVSSCTASARAEDHADIRELKLRDWQPRSMLVTKATDIECHHLQGFWQIYGVFQPDEVLEKTYNRHAERIQLTAVAADKTNATIVEKQTADTEKTPELHVRPTKDFEVTGDGSARAWQDISWVPLAKRPGSHPSLAYDAKVKLLHSKSGIYILFSGSDGQLTAKLNEDFLDLWNEDVFEFFFWTDERHPIYFEYEISPLGYELPILIPNVDSRFLGWRPWHYEGERKTKKKTAVMGGEKKSGENITGWTAEVFVPYKLLEPLGNVPPKPGARWRANFYRVDYDGGKSASWDWARVGPSFHEFQKFGTLVFD